MTSQPTIVSSQGETPDIPPQHISCIVAIHAGDKEQRVVGAGFLVDSTHVLTSREVVHLASASTPRKSNEDEIVWISQASEANPRMLRATPRKRSAMGGFKNDLVGLEIIDEVPWPEGLAAEFAAPPSYEGREFVIATFPAGRRQLFFDAGRIIGPHSDDAMTLSEHHAKDGFGGAPLWSPEVNGFIGMVNGQDSRICITSTELCSFYRGMAVKFRIPPSERPEIKDYDVDDPNVGFGTVSNDGNRRLTARVRKQSDNLFSVKMTYQTLPSSPPPRGRFVTFITYPDMEDEYEMTAELDPSGKAEAECHPRVPDFTIAAIGDGGNTRLTFNLATLTPGGAAPNPAPVPSKAPEPNPSPPGQKPSPAGSSHETPAVATPTIPEPHASRIMAIHSGSNREQIIGAGCLVDRVHVLTCLSVARNALQRPKEGTDQQTLLISQAGQPNSPPLAARIVVRGNEDTRVTDLALLEIVGPAPTVSGPDAEFATLLNYAGKEFRVMTFPSSHRQGILSGGQFESSGGGGTQWLGAYNAGDGGFAGSPLWSPELNAFFGLVSGSPQICVTSAGLCEFFPALAVKFRIPPSEKPEVKDYEVDDPNVALFGTVSDDGKRRLSATLGQGTSGGYYPVRLTYQTLPGSEPPRGRFVTFITYPDMGEYELFAEIDTTGKAEVECRPFVPDFIVAAIGDGGATRLTLDLSQLVEDDDAASKAPPIPPTPKPAPSDTPEYASGPSGFNSEYCAVGRKAEVQDQLNVENFAKRLAELVVLRETRLPLAVGLFGNWGSGKSYFMNLLDHHMQSKAKEAREDWEKRKRDWEKREKEKQEKKARGKESGEKPPDKGPWCHQMVPVYFNAWHYVDTNLWASLVAHIFESLFLHLKPKPNELKKVQEMLEHASGTAARATEELAIAKEEAGKAQAELAAAKVAHAQQQTFVRGLLDSLKALLPDARKEKDRQKAARTLGAEKALETFEQLQEVVAEAQTTAGRTRTFWNSFRGQGWAWRVGWLLVAVGAIFLEPRLVAYWKLTGGAEVLAKWAAYLTPWLSLAGVALAKANSALKTMEEWEAKAREAQEQKRRNDPAVKGAEQKAQAADARVQAAQSRLAEAEAKQKQLREEAANLAPERRIARFIEQRAQSSDYKGQLGLVSLARRDFEELSNLFANTDALKKMDKELREKEKDAEAKRVKAEEAAAKAERAQKEAEKKATEETNETAATAAKADAARNGKMSAAARTGAARKKKAAAAARADQKRLQEASDSIDRIVLFVDDLDRCQTDKVVDVLQAVHLLLAFPLFAVVVGVDQRCLRQSLQKQFKGLLTPAEKSGKVKRSPLMEMDAERPATPLDYLEKIFHIPFHLPPMEKKGFEDLIANLTEPRNEGAFDQSNAQEQPAAKPPAPASPPVPAVEGNRAVDAAKPVVPPAPIQAASPVQAALDAGGMETKLMAAESPGDLGKTATPAQTKQPAPVVEKNRVGSTPLHDWERNALKEYYALITTPRGVTRLLNTYRLMRAGIPKDEWGLFCGDQKTSGEFRVAMLLLAVSAGRPSVARNWFARMRKMRVAGLDGLAEPNESEVGSLKEWGDFVKDFDLAVHRLQPQPEPARFETWFRRVERFTF